MFTFDTYSMNVDISSFTVACISIIGCPIQALHVVWWLPPAEKKSCWKGNCEYYRDVNLNDFAKQIIAINIEQLMITRFPWDATYQEQFCNILGVKRAHMFGINITTQMQNNLPKVICCALINISQFNFTCFFTNCFAYKRIVFRIYMYYITAVTINMYTYLLNGLYNLRILINICLLSLYHEPNFQEMLMVFVAFLL